MLTRPDGPADVVEVHVSEDHVGHLGRAHTGLGEILEEVARIVGPGGRRCPGRPGAGVHQDHVAGDQQQETVDVQRPGAVAIDLREDLLDRLGEGTARVAEHQRAVAGLVAARNHTATIRRRHLVGKRL
jgi:hypothetical protein